MQFSSIFFIEFVALSAKSSIIMSVLTPPSFTFGSHFYAKYPLLFVYKFGSDAFHLVHVRLPPIFDRNQPVPIRFFCGESS